MHVRFVQKCVVLLFSISLAFTEVAIEDGGYNILVAFSQNVLSQNGTEIIEDMKISLQEASEILYNAIGIQFSKVTFEIPEYWDISEWNITIADYFTIDSPKADIVIDSADDIVFGKFPYAQQYGSCNVPGHQIIVPTAFFDELNAFPKGISLAREWLKYRYGVFDENGYLEDPLYPLYYHTPGSDANEVHFTDCTNSKITYNFRDQDGNECPSNKILIDQLKSHDCSSHINEEDLENVTSSLMYFQEAISSMTHVCGRDHDHKHNSRSPNKQNILCNRESIWDIISNSDDFKNKDIKKDYGEAEFVFIKKAKPRVVVAWENTKKLNPKGNVILSAITKLMLDLPHGSKFSAFPFRKDVPADDIKLKDLDGVNTRQAIALGIKSDFVKPEDGDFDGAIAKAFNILKAAAENPDKPPPGHIIVITGIQDVLNVVLLCFVNSNPQNIIENISDSRCSKMVNISMSDETEAIYEKLIETMESICPSKVYDKVTETMKIESLKKDTSLDVTVDDLTEKVTFWIFSNKEGENFALKFNGEETKKERRKEETYGNVLELSYLPTQAGSIDFSYPYDTDPMLIEVKKTSKAGKYFTGEVIVHDTTGVADNFQMPVIIYAIVRFGSYPLQNAKVSAMIRRPDGYEIELELNDDGIGDPDITQNDGVYSRYFTNFSSEGDYAVTVVVKNNELTTRYGADNTAGYTSCCGSVVKNGDTHELKEFTKVYEKTFKTRSGRPEDGYKPSRITNLRIDKLTEDGMILKWTAPGEEADSGTASNYEIKIFCGKENKTECNIQKAVQVVNKPHPLKYGKEQKLKIQVVVKTQVLSIAIITFNENKSSDLSNIVEIFRPNETLTEITVEDPKVKAAPVSKTGIIVGCVVAGILIVICILGAVACLRRKQDEKPEIYNIEDSNKIKPTFEATDISMKTASVKKIESFPVLLYTHDQIKESKNKEDDLPLYKSNVPPKQWKSLDVIANLKRDDRDVKSLSSTSTINIEE